MKLSIAGAAVALFSAGANAQLPAIGTGITCVSPDDCAPGEMCANSNSNVCAKIGCQTHYDILLAQNPGMGDLECEDYAGEFPGLIYACSVGEVISGGSFGVDVNPKDGTAVTQPFQRECKAFIPASNDEFYCNDNDGASYEDYLKSVGDALLSCDGDAPIHGFPQFNLIGGVSLGALRVETFSETNAESAFYIGTRSGSSSLVTDEDLIDQNTGKSLKASLMTFATVSSVVFFL